MSYEITYIISSQLDEKAASGFKDAIEDLVKKLGGTIASSSLPEKKYLSYPIKKSHEAYFATMNFEMQTEKIDELKKDLRFRKEMLRYLVLKKKISAKKEKEIKPRRLPRSDSIAKEKLFTRKAHEKPEEIIEIDKEIEELIK